MQAFISAVLQRAQGAAYKGISGSFKLTITGNEVIGVPCGRWSGPSLAEAIFIAGPGTVSFR